MTRDEILAEIRRIEDREKIPRGLLYGVAMTESGLDPTARSPKGALGLLQFISSTAAELEIDPLDPAQAIDGGGRYLNRLRRTFGSWPLALAAYNWGPHHLTLALAAREVWPQETEDYVARVYHHAADHP
jgi:soluble lytic murein transglycosylase-like protein